MTEVQGGAGSALPSGWETPQTLREICGAAYAVRTAGWGPATAVLLHGWPDDGRLWRHQVAPLVAAGYRVVAPDLLGFGGSAQPDDLGRYAAPALAADLLSLAASFTDAPFHLVAHDWGALVGWQMAEDAPERLASFTTISVGHLGALLALDHAKLSALWYYLLTQAPHGAQAMLAGDGALLRFFLATHPDGPGVADALVSNPARLESMRRIELAHPVDQLLIAAFETAAEPPPAVRVPTLAIHGLEDPLMAAAQVVDSEPFVAAPWSYLSLEGAGHWPMLEQPERVAQALLAWFARHPA